MSASAANSEFVARTYAERVTDLLAALGYTHCFVLPGGAIMHLVNAARSRMTCIPVVHEMSAVIAAEYFNQVSPVGRAYALVTAGPGVTNALTGMAGAYLESRDVLVVAGQVKAPDLSRGLVRQRGIQELDGLEIVRPVTVAAARFEEPASDDEVEALVLRGLTDRPGPVYLEFCLDVQGAPSQRGEVKLNPRATGPSLDLVHAARDVSPLVVDALKNARRPVVLVGGGVSYQTAVLRQADLASRGLPLMTTWNGFDRIADDNPSFAGRPNTWGQRSANVILAQADCIVALGTRLGVQQTGFNWQEWGPAQGEGRVIQVDIDSAELVKGHPRVDIPLHADANTVLSAICDNDFPSYDDWWTHITYVRSVLPLIDPANSKRANFVSPYELCRDLSCHLTAADVIVPASSGSGQFVPMETLSISWGQRVLTNKGLASMGYGLAGALGAAAATGRRTILIEGDGSFSQNIQELGTVALQRLPIKIFLLDNDGYASIRTTQRNYFGGAYLGCDSSTGLGFPDWQQLAQAFNIPSCRLGESGLSDPEVQHLLSLDGPAIFVVPVDPEQTYYPKVASRLTAGGRLESNPTHFMSPPLSAQEMKEVFVYRQVDSLD